MLTISTGWPASTGVSLTAFQCSPSINTLPPAGSIRESAILAVASTQPQAIVRDSKIVVRQMMKLTLSCDHRIVDGALGAKFTNAIKQKLEDIELWKRLTT